METRKFKIEQRGGIVTKYYWGKWFLFFGQWIPYHNISFGNNDYANPSAMNRTKAEQRTNRFLTSFSPRNANTIVGRRRLINYELLK